MKLIGIGLIIFGVVALIYHGVSIAIPQDTVNLGAFSITWSENKTIPLPPILGGFSLLVGVLLILLSGRNR
jgi:hypothetical protein